MYNVEVVSIDQQFNKSEFNQSGAFHDVCGSCGTNRRADDVYYNMMTALDSNNLDLDLVPFVLYPDFHATFSYTDEISVHEIDQTHDFPASQSPDIQY